MRNILVREDKRWDADHDKSKNNWICLTFSVYRQVSLEALGIARLSCTRVRLLICVCVCMCVRETTWVFVRVCMRHSAWPPSVLWLACEGGLRVRGVAYALQMRCWQQRCVCLRYMDNRVCQLLPLCHWHVTCSQLSCYGWRAKFHGALYTYIYI